MLSIIHGFVYVLVGCLLLCPIVLPFWKVWKRLKSHHPDIWQARGPFDPVTMLAHGYVVKNFFEIIALAEYDETLRTRDPVLVKWTRVSREMLRLLPRSFFGQVFAMMVFLALLYAFSNEIIGLFEMLFRGRS